MGDEGLVLGRMVEIGAFKTVPKFTFYSKITWIKSARPSTQVESTCRRMLAMRRRQQEFAPSDGSRTLTITNDSTQEDSDNTQLDSERENIIGSLRLRGAHRRTHVAWGEDVIDNEGCGKKKSKSLSL